MCECVRARARARASACVYVSVCVLTCTFVCVCICVSASVIIIYMFVLLPKFQVDILENTLWVTSYMCEYVWGWGWLLQSAVDWYCCSTLIFVRLQVFTVHNNE